MIGSDENVNVQLRFRFSTIIITNIFLQTTCNGEVRLANVRFRYPTRRKVKVLRNLNFNVQPGQTVALVGTSGCGKSTSVSLVERFYDALGGSVVSMFTNSITTMFICVIDLHLQFNSDDIKITASLTVK